MFIDEDKYKMIIENIIIEAVDLLIINAKWEVLLWLRQNAPLKWIYYIPWGRRYKNEKMIDSIKRKAFEELWIQINEAKLAFLWIYDDIYEESIFDNMSSHYSSITYIYHLDDEEQNHIKIDNQHDDIKFFDLKDPDIHQAVKIRIQDMLNM